MAYPYISFFGDPNTPKWMTGKNIKGHAQLSNPAWLMNDK